MNKSEAVATLQTMLKPGDTVCTILRHVSRSGMSRSIDLFTHTPEGPHEITYFAALAMNDRVDRKHGGIKAGGCGMDMGYALVHNLSHALFSEFVCIGKGCPSNDHSNGDRSYEPHQHSDVGYALKQRWL